MEIVTTIIILALIGSALYWHGAETGAQDAELKAAVNQFEKKNRVTVAWSTSTPHQFNEMCWIAYGEGNHVSYEIFHHRARRLDELESRLKSVNTPYTINYFQFSALKYFSSPEEIEAYKRREGHDK